jgi:hypothetical protein
VGERAAPDHRLLAPALLALVALLATSAFLATRESTAHALGQSYSRVLAALLIAGGPLSGWAIAILTGHLWGWIAGGLLVPATFFTMLPVGLWLRQRHTCWLILAFGPWVASGYLFGVAIWI